MAEDPYTIVLDLPNRLMYVTMRGFWNEAVTSSYEAAALAAFQEMRKSGESFDAINDLTDFSVQTADVIATLAEFAETTAMHGPGRVAMISNSSLLKRQTARAASGVTTQTFPNQAEAMEWLRPSK